jgi:1,4-alpha-glucan branching enzyme
VRNLSQVRSQLGVTLAGETASFGVWAPFADSVAVSGSFNNWSPDANPLERHEDGCWYGSVQPVLVGQEYQYVIKHGDEILTKNDPRALQLTAAGDATIIVDPDFDWGDDDFTLPPPNQRVIYELHIGTFHRTDPATPGSFKTAQSKLDHLEALGVNVIEVLPVNGTNMERWWGYEPTYLFAVDAAYGGRQAFLEFVKAAHKRGIGVFVDVVYNHMSPNEGLDLWRFDGWSENDKGGIYFYNDWRGETPWGPRPDYGRIEVRQYITDSARAWLSDCHVDGLRVDATFAIRNVRGRNDDPAADLADGWKLMQELSQTTHELKPPATIIAEDMAINEYLTKPISEGGAGFDAQWESSFPYSLRAVLNPINDADRKLGPLRDHITKSYNNQPFQRILFSESHDADANGHARMNEEIAPGDAGDLYARRRSILAAAVALTAPGIPMLFQGQEFMESGWFNHWQALDWHKAKQFPGIVHLYSDLIKLRRNLRHHTAGLQGAFLNVVHLDETAKVLAYHRKDHGGPGDDVVVVFNFATTPQLKYQIAFPGDGGWKARLNSDWHGYSPDFTNTPTPEVTVAAGKGVVNLGPYSVIILSQD